MNESFETIVSDTYGKIELIERGLKRSKNLQMDCSPFHIKILITNLIAIVECCKDLPIFSRLNHLGKEEVLSSLCLIHDSFYRLADLFYTNIEQIYGGGESAGNIYELMNDIAFEVLLYLQINHEEYVEYWNKL